MAKFLIRGFLKIAEFIEELLVGSLTVSELLLKLVVSEVEFIPSLRQMGGFGLVNIHQILLDHFEILGVSSLQILDLRGVLLVELHFEIVVGVQHTIHVLFSLLLGFQERLLSSVKLVIKSLDLVHQSSILTLQEVLILREQIDLAAKLLRSSLDFVLSVLKLDELLLQDLVVRLNMLVFDFKLSDLFFAIHGLIFVLVAVLDLRSDILVVRFKLLVSPLKSIDSPGRVISEVLEMASHVFLLHSLSLELSFQLNELGNCLVVVKLILFQVLDVGLQSIVHFDLNELFERLILLHFEFHVLLFRNQKLVRGEFLLVEFQLLLEGGKLIHELFLGVLQLANNLAATVLLLLQSELEVGALSLQNLGELALLQPQLINLFLHLADSLAELLLLGG